MNRADMWRTGFLVLIYGWCFACGDPAVAAEPPGSAPAWSLDSAYRQDNGLRARITLNGVWRLKFPDRKGVFCRRVPGAGPLFSIRDAAGKDLLGTLKGKEMLKTATAPCVLEREFTLPGAWKGRRVRIVFESMEGEGEILLDHKRMGFCWPEVPYALDLPAPYKFDKPYLLQVKCRGITGNVWLKSFVSARDSRINDSYLMTSVRKMQATLRAEGSGPATTRLRLVITDYGNARKVAKTVGPIAVKGDGKTWKAEFSFPWKDARLWSLAHPNLYRYFLEMLDGNGKVVDRIFPIRFGFREIWIKGGYFMLNRHRITLTMNIHTCLGQGVSGRNRYLGHTSSHYEKWKQIIAQHKMLGVNTMVFRGSANEDDSSLFRAADELGFFVSVHLHGQQRGDPQQMAVASIRQHRRDKDVRLIKMHRHYPCIPFYYLGNVHNTWDYEFKKLGENYDVEKLTGRMVKPETTLVSELDPARVAFAGGGGGKDQAVHSSMNYMHIDSDLQVHETWPAHWYRRRLKPLATYEMAEPSFIGNWYMRRDRSNWDRYHPFFLEISAIYFGEDVYLQEPRETVRKWLRAAQTKKNNVCAAWPKWEVACYKRVAKLCTRNVYRAWRTYGVNMGLFTQVRSYFAGKHVVFEPEPGDPRAPGMHPDRAMSLYEPLANQPPLNEVGVVAQKALSLLLMYIGGPDGDFTLKDRSYFAGETIRKAVVVLNDREQQAVVSGTWELVDHKGGKVAVGKLPRVTLQPGELAPAKIHIEFKAPPVKQRTGYVLNLRGSADAKGCLDDSFPITVFPRPQVPVLSDKLKIFLYDPIGDTRKMLDAAGIKYSLLGGTLPDPKTGLVVVGRNALRDKLNRRSFHKLLYDKMGYDFSVNVSNGMRVIVFEQAMENIWGLKTEQTRWRRAFIRAPGHPLLLGLGKGDFQYLRGYADLVAPDPDPPACKPGRVGADRTTEWGNDNVACTFSMLKPQLGAVRAIVDCGFDLQEAALLEAVGGKGRLLFCQLDVTNRYGRDPVSTILVNNIFAYMTTVAPPDPAVGKPIDLVREGWEDYDVKIRKCRGLFMADKPEGPISWGISAADLYFEGFVDVPAFIGKDNKRYLYGPVPGEKAFGHTLNRRKFKTRWQKMKIMIVRAALRINQGGSADTFPATSLQNDNEELYPMEWMQGFVSPYLYMNW